MSLGFSITRNSALANDAPFVAFGLHLAARLLGVEGHHAGGLVDRRPRGGSDGAGLERPLDARHASGLAAAVMLVPDSSGIVAFCGATVTPEIGLSAQRRRGRASRPRSPGRPPGYPPSSGARGSPARSSGAPASPSASSPAGWRADAPSADTTGAIRPSAIARPTAWFPAVICIDRRTSSDIGTPLIRVPRRSGRRRRAGSRGRRGWTSPPTASRPAPRPRSGCARSGPASMRVGLPAEAPSQRDLPHALALQRRDVQVRADDRRAARRSGGRGPRHLRVRESPPGRRTRRPRPRPPVVAPAPDQVDLVARVLAELARPQPPAPVPREPLHVAVPERPDAHPAPVRVHAQDLAVARRPVLRQRRVAGVADARVELAVGPERDPPAVVDARRAQPGQHRPHAPAQLEAHDPVVPARRREVRVHEPIRAYRGETASPSSPPSPALRATPGTVITALAAPRRRRESAGSAPSSRSATSASPSGRNAIPHGTSSPVAITRRARRGAASPSARRGPGVSFGVAVAGGVVGAVVAAGSAAARVGPTPGEYDSREQDRPALHRGGGRCAGSLTTVTKNSSIWRTTSMKRLKSTGLVT